MIHYIKKGNVSINSIITLHKCLYKLPKSIQKILSDNEVFVYITNKIIKNDEFINGVVCPEKNYVVVREKNIWEIPSISPETLYHECAHLIDYYSNSKSGKYYSEENRDFLSAWNQESNYFFKVFIFRDNSTDGIDVVEAFAYISAYYMLKNEIMLKKIKDNCPLLYEQVESFYKKIGN